MSHLARQLRQLAADTGESFIAGHEPSWWLRTRLVDLYARARAGQVAGCPHLWPWTTAFAALWLPDLMVCAECAPALRVTGEADRTCDRCGTVAAGVHPVMVAATETLLVSLGLCAVCYRREMGR